MSTSTFIRAINLSLPWRIAVGMTVFACLAGVDLLRHGRAATRWREYAFLLAAVLVAMAYGAANDQISSRISWEYFYYGKELAPILGHATPPDPARLYWQAARIGVEATWSAGLLAGAALLIANNPRPGRPRLAYARLLALLPQILLTTAAFGVAGGLLGSVGWLNWISDDFREMWRMDYYRPRHFLCTYGIHLGGYVGGLLGTIWAVMRVRSLRRPSGTGAVANLSR